MKEKTTVRRLLIPDEAAQFLRISLKSFYKRASKGELPIIKVGGLIRVDSIKLERYLDQRSRGCDAQTL